MNTVKSIINEIEPDLIQIRHHLHKHPELSFNEFNTSAYIKSVLNKNQIKYKDGFVKTGIVAEIGLQNKPIIAIRADMDALPIAEENNCEYKSVNHGIMHACGHDVHTTCALGAAIALKKIESSINGKILIVFQPGEEVLPGGAQLMIQEGAFGNSLPDAIVGLHVFPEMEIGNLGFCIGEYMASSDEIFIEIIGKGGHAAMPEYYNNPLLIASKLLMCYSGEFDYKNTIKHTKAPSVLAFGKIIGNGATNVIPEKVCIEGTFRAMDEEWRQVAHKKITALANEIAIANDCKIIVNIKKGYPVLINNKLITEKCMHIASLVFDNNHIHVIPKRMTAEDFAFYSQIMPACFFRLGTRNEKENIVSPVHTSTFNIDEKAIVIGATALATMALELTN